MDHNYYKRITIVKKKNDYCQPSPPPHICNSIVHSRPATFRCSIQRYIIISNYMCVARLIYNIIIFRTNLTTIYNNYNRSLSSLLSIVSKTFLWLLHCKTTVAAVNCFTATVVAKYFLRNAYECGVIG